MQLMKRIRHVQDSEDRQESGVKLEGNMRYPNSVDRHSQAGMDQISAPPDATPLNTPRPIPSGCVKSWTLDIAAGVVKYAPVPSPPQPTTRIFPSLYSSCAGRATETSCTSLKFESSGDWASRQQQDDHCKLEKLQLVPPFLGAATCVPTTTMDSEDISDLSSIPSSPLSSPPDSPIIPPEWRAPTPPPSQEATENAEEDMLPARKRRKIEPKIRTTQHLDLTSEVTQSEYDHRNSLDLLLKILRKCRKIVVIAGAGISVSAGIPDFRSSHGLFSSLRNEHKLKSSGKELFDASVYKDDLSTASFHDMVRDLSRLAAEAKPTPFHQLLARLAQEGRLLRLYTQNVDGIDTSLPPLATQVPLRHKGPWPQTIQLHGGLEKMMCQKCRHTSDFQPQLFQGPEPPLCPECTERDSLRTNHAGKRSHGIGKLRPRIVLYNEHNPDEEAIGAVVTADLRTRPDAIVVVGTSMKIPGVKRIVREMCSVVRSKRNGVSLWINRDPVPPGKDFEDCWDLVIKGDCDSVAHQVDLKDLDYQSADPPEEYTMSDVERVKARQGPITVVVPQTPRKKDSTKHMAGIVTPPLEAGEESNSFKVKPIKLKLKMSPSPEKHMKNPASVGRTLVEVLGKENKIKQVGRSKSTVSKKGLVRTGKKQSLGVITGKVTKPPSAKSSKPESKKATKPLSPRRDHNSIVLFPNLSQQYSSAEPSPAPDSPVPRDWRNENTISPTGCLPSGMARLLS